MLRNGRAGCRSRSSILPTKDTLMKTNMKELRLAVQAKLEERRKLLNENASLKTSVRRAEETKTFILDAVKSRVMNFALEQCADEIVNRILDEALKASELLAYQAEGPRDADLIVGINIPALRIMHCIPRQETMMRYNEPIRGDEIAVRRIDLNTRNYREAVETRANRDSRP